MNFAKFKFRDRLLVTLLFVFIPLILIHEDGNIVLGTFVCVALLLLIWATFIISRFVTNPLGKMIDTLEKGASGDYSVRMDEQGSVEFITLSRHFNRFMHQLEDNTARLEKEIHKNIESHQALVENDLMLRGLFDQSFHYVAILSPFGRVERVNQRALDLGQTAPGDVLYRPFWETVWWQHDPKVSRQLQDAIEKAKKGDLVRYETTCVGNKGAIRDIDLSIKSVFLPSGGVAFIIAEGRDITEYKKTAHEKKELAVQLERSRKMEAIGTLAGGIAHDFNNILSGILGYSQLAQMNLDHPSRAKNHMKQIGQGIQRAAELIQQILTFSRQTEYEKKALKLYIVVKEALKLVRSSLPATIEIKESMLTTDMVLADPTQMHQVIMNLCTNAYHAMIKTGGVLSVRLKSVELVDAKDVFDRKITPDTYIELMVADTGCGMDEYTFSKAFDPYFTTKEVGKGTGFGLALVNAIVDEHGGYIQAQTAPGKGSSFYVYLPVVTSPAGKYDEPKKVVVIQGGTEHIMVVDDEKDIRNILREYLESLGYTVSVFNDGVQAFTAFESAPSDFDMIITDMTMPKMTGDIFAVKALALRKDIPVILCTGYSETVSEARMLEAGVRKYIQKPVDTIQLSAVIRSIFDSKIEPDAKKES
ncbi:MAG: response regulator [Proteobacteria bacterium]|nr:response regulator [Pseudomonadota bacterium]MBU1389849.1 response regulator [Pseudomonadota bacterium]MBU1543858.1 response regulator [Pseudomonadota bacterium]MBU2481105.1 response regulator [Pseudomonadota bacterium]